MAHHDSSIKGSNPDVHEALEGQFTYSGVGKNSEDTLTENVQLRAKPITKEEEEEARRRAEDEWAQVEVLQTDKTYTTTEDKKSAKDVFIKYDDVQDYFFSLDLTEQKKNIVTTDTRNRNFFTALKDCLCVPNWTPEMFEERETTFCIAQIQFNNADRVHTQILQTIYMKLTGAKMECPRFGSHWEVIGFQGNDPATDLRGVGMLGLLHTLHFIQEYPKVADDIFQLSRDDLQNFPFCLVGLSMTRISLESLREGLLTSLCHKYESVFDGVLEVHHASFLLLYQIWKGEKKTIKEFGFVLKRVTEEVKADPRHRVDAFHEYLEQQNAKVNGKGTKMSFGEL